MTDGEKWNLFVLDLSWIGWLLLGGLTLGILNIFFVTPYMVQTEAEVYRVLAQRIGGGEDFSSWGSQNATDVEPEVFSEYTENSEEVEKQDPQQAADGGASEAQAAGEEKSQDDRDFDI